MTEMAVTEDSMASRATVPAQALIGILAKAKFSADLTSAERDQVGGSQQPEAPGHTECVPLGATGWAVARFLDTRSVLA